MAWDDTHLEHMCKLSTIVVNMIRDPSCEMSADHIANEEFRNMLSILAETFVELQKRQGIKPRFGRMK